jgi:hypothetical protein
MRWYTAPLQKWSWQAPHREAVQGNIENIGESQAEDQREDLGN